MKGDLDDSDSLKRAVKDVHSHRDRLTLQMYRAAQLLCLWRGLEYGCVITSLGMYSTVAWMKPLKILLDHFN